VHPVLEITGGEEPHALTLDGVQVTIGRAPSNSLVLDDGEVSRHHLVLDRVGAAWIARELGSANGTSLNGAPLTRDTTLRDGDVLVVGSTALAFRAAPTDRGLPPTIQTRAVGAAPSQAGGDTAGSGRVAPAETNVFRLEGDIWHLAFAGEVTRLKDRKGLHDIARLLLVPGIEVAAVDLLAPRVGGSPGGMPGTQGMALEGGVGPALDATAREEYRRRLVELEEEIAEAEAHNDPGRAGRANEEREFLLAELGAAVGLGGRARPALDPAERARKAVTWRIRETLSRIEAAHVPLGRHLRRSLRTGTFCVYDPAEPTSWELIRRDAPTRSFTAQAPGVRAVRDAHRMLATVLFTDLVDSTRRAAEVGDRRWGKLLDTHDELVRNEVDRCRGRLWKMTGDGVLATFDAPGRAIRCALGIREGLQGAGLLIRAGLHTGEIELRGADVGGIGVHIAARVSATAGPSEVLVSRTVKDLVAGSGITFVDRGTRSLKCVPGRWQLFAVEV
jgi:class 3 adenylate cyclase